MFTHHKSAAYSLIELLVSIVIIMLLTGGALAGYTRYIDKQRLIASAEKIESGLREAQNMARIGYLGECDGLASVRFYAFMQANRLYYQIRTYCAEDSSNTLITTQAIDYDLDICTDVSGTTCGQNINLYFKPYEFVSVNLSRTIKSTINNFSATFDIDQGGGIKVTYN